MRALWKIDVYLISTLVNKSLYYLTGVTRRSCGRAVGLLVKWYVPNSFHSFHVIQMKRAKQDHYKDLIYMTYIISYILCESRHGGSKVKLLFRICFIYIYTTQTTTTFVISFRRFLIVCFVSCDSGYTHHTQLQLYFILFCLYSEGPFSIYKPGIISYVHVFLKKS